MLNSEELYEYQLLWDSYEREMNRLVFTHYPCASRVSPEGKPSLTGHPFIFCRSKITKWGIDYPEYGDVLGEEVVETLYLLVKKERPELIWAIRMTINSQKDNDLS